MEKETTNNNFTQAAEKFLADAKSAFDVGNYPMTRAWCAAAMQLPRESESDFYEIYQLLYKTFLAEEDFKSAQDYLVKCMRLEPSNKDHTYDWYTKFETIFFSYGEAVPTDFIEPIVFSSTVDSGNRPIEGAKPDWIVIFKEPINLNDLYFAIKLATDNAKHFVQIKDVGYAVRVNFAQKLGVKPTDYMLPELAADYKQYIKSNI